SRETSGAATNDDYIVRIEAWLRLKAERIGEHAERWSLETTTIRQDRERQRHSGENGCDVVGRGHEPLENETRHAVGIIEIPPRKVHAIPREKLAKLEAAEIVLPPDQRRSGHRRVPH